MRRTKQIERSGQGNIELHKRRIAIHEAGHAVAIMMNTKLKQLPKAFFQIKFNDVFQTTTLEAYMAAGGDYSAQVKEGCLIKHLPDSIGGLINNLGIDMQKKEDICQQLFTAFIVDIVNLLIGPLAEAKYVALNDGEVFNHNLVDISALQNYGGASDLTLINLYLASFASCKHQQKQLLDKLFLHAFDFLNSIDNWQNIMTLADYIIEKDVTSIDYKEKEIEVLLNS